MNVLWSQDFDGYAEGRLEPSAVRCVLCLAAPCQCPPFGTPAYFALLDERHGRRPAVRTRHEARAVGNLIRQLDEADARWRDEHLDGQAQS